MTSEPVKCPCCGQRTKDFGVRVNLNWNALYFRDIEIGLTPQQAEIAHILARRMPEVVGHDAIIEQLWGSSEPDNAYHHVQVCVYALRKRLLRAGIGITNFKERGYALILLPVLTQTERSTPTEATYAHA